MIRRLLLALLACATLAHAEVKSPGQNTAGGPITGTINPSQINAGALPSGVTIQNASLPSNITVAGMFQVNSNLVADGTTNNSTALLADNVAAHAGGPHIIVPPSGVSTIALSSDVYLGPTSVGGNGLTTSLHDEIDIDPNAVFSGSLIRFDYLVPTQVAPILSYRYFGNTYNAADYSAGYTNVFQSLDVAQQNGTSAAVVARGALATLQSDSGNSVWAANFICSVYVTSSHICYGLEVDVDSLASGTHTRAIDVHGAGTNANYIGYRLTANGASSGFQYGFNIDASSFNPVTGTFMLVSGTHMASATFFDFSAATASTFEQKFPSFEVGATPSMTNGSGILVTASAANTPSLGTFANGTATPSLNLVGQTQINLQTEASPLTQVQILDTASATHSLTLTGGASGGFATIGTSDASAIQFSSNLTYPNNTSFKAAGTGATTFGNLTDGIQLAITDGGGATAAYPIIHASKTGTNVSYGVSGAGPTTVAFTTPGTTGGYVYSNGGGNMLQLSGVASAVNYLNMTDAVTTAAPSLAAIGTDTNISISINPKGTGSFTTPGAVTFPGLASSSTGTTGTLCWTTGTGNVNVDTTTTCLLSDGRLKENVQPLEPWLAKLMLLKPVSYDLKAEVNPTGLGRQVGLIAQDVIKVDPRLAAVYQSGPNKGTPSGVRYEQMVAALVESMQEQQREIEALRFQPRGT